MDKAIRDYLDSNFLAIRAETKAMSDVLSSELRESRKINEMQHNHIIDKISDVAKRVNDCEEEGVNLHSRVI